MIMVTVQAFVIVAKQH